MYYVQSASNMLYKVSDALKVLFGDKADVQWSNGKVYVRVKSGFPSEDHYLTPAQISQGVIGGGRIDGLDGKMFVIDTNEIKEWPWKD